MSMKKDQKRTTFRRAALGLSDGVLERVKVRIINVFGEEPIQA